ncbi:MAG: histidine kinase [Chitinophagaceae bacterium]
MRIAIFLTCLLLSVRCHAQDLNTDLLKQQIPFLKDSAKALALLKLASTYAGSWQVRTDSGMFYAKMAYNYAKENNYKLAWCRASLLLARVSLQASHVSDGMKYYHEMVKLAQELNRKDALANGIRGLGEAYWYSADYDQAITYIKMSITLFEELGWRRDISQAQLAISNIYGDQGIYEKAFEWNQKAFEYSTKLQDKDIVTLTLVEMGKLYKNIGDYEVALEYFRKSYAMQPYEGSWGFRYLMSNMGDLYCDLKQYDSAHYYLRRAFIGHAEGKTARLRMGRFFLEQKQYDSAMTYYSGLYKDLKGTTENGIFIYSMLGMSNVYFETHKPDLAFKYAKEAFNLAEVKNSKMNLRDACRLLYLIYEKRGQSVPAFTYYKKYVNLKDSLITDQFKGKLYEFRRIADNEKKQAEIELLEKEKLIAQQKLKGNRFLRNLLAEGILLLAILSFIIVWSISLKRKNEKLKNERIHSALEHKARDLEMQALRAQMNPHFIFNCLSSINRFILKNESERASDYLTRFSRLIRLVLINSQKSLISLEDEVEMLRLYIEMEQLRFKNSFDYSITYNNDVQPGNVVIPPLLLQPFCENAIWHGLMHKEGHGKLSIEFTMKRQTLYCKITDNGIGRAKAAEVRNHATEKVKSLGLKLTTERLALFNENKEVETFYDIEDVIDEEGNVAGTQVMLRINYRESIDQPL